MRILVAGASGYIGVLETPSGSRLVQTAFFEPKGLPGLAYRYVLYPIHGLIFRGMVRVLAERATSDPQPARKDGSGDPR
jgi:hypothetical protein